MYVTIEHHQFKFFTTNNARIEVATWEAGYHN